MIFLESLDPSSVPLQPEPLSPGQDNELLYIYVPLNNLHTAKKLRES